MLQKSAFDLAAALAGILSYDEQPCRWIGGKFAIAPRGAGVEFGLFIRSWEIDYVAGRFPDLHLAPVPPCVEERTLHRKQAIEAGQQQRRPGGGVACKQRNQPQRDPAGAYQPVVAADVFECGQPGAEGGAVLLPGIACEGAQVARGVGA